MEVDWTPPAGAADGLEGQRAQLTQEQWQRNRPTERQGQQRLRGMRTWLSESGLPQTSTHRSTDPVRVGPDPARRSRRPHSAAVTLWSCDSRSEDVELQATVTVVITSLARSLCTPLCCVCLPSATAGPPRRPRTPNEDEMTMRSRGGHSWGSRGDERSATTQRHRCLWEHSMLRCVPREESCVLVVRNPPSESDGISRIGHFARGLRCVSSFAVSLRVADTDRRHHRSSSRIQLSLGSSPSTASA